jgi:hypothetical protein
MKRCLSCGTSRHSSQIELGSCRDKTVCARRQAKRGDWTIAWRKQAADRIDRDLREELSAREYRRHL